VTAASKAAETQAPREWDRPELRHEHESTTEESCIKDRKDQVTHNAQLLNELLKPRRDETQP
jgi:hypothetical protein